MTSGPAKLSVQREGSLLQLSLGGRVLEFTSPETGTQIEVYMERSYVRGPTGSLHSIGCAQIPDLMIETTGPSGRAAEVLELTKPLACFQVENFAVATRELAGRRYFLGPAAPVHGLPGAAGGLAVIVAVQCGQGDVRVTRLKLGFALSGCLQVASQWKRTADVSL